MLSLPSASHFSSSSLKLLNPNKSSTLLKSLSCCSITPQPTTPLFNHAGLKLDETVEFGPQRTRLDSWISSRLHSVSRARIQSTIKSGLVKVNGRPINKVSHIIRGGDVVTCIVSELKPLRAEPEDIPLDIVYEDEHVLVVNKPPHMVVHPAPGNANGTLVNAILHHCSLPIIARRNNARDSETESSEGSDDDLDDEEMDDLDDDEMDDLDDDEMEDDEMDDLYLNQSSMEELNLENSDALVRPGIVHRLDKGTSGLLVVAKDEHSHARLAEQFKLHTIERIYASLTTGVPSPSSGRIEVPIARDSKNRIRMAAVPGSNPSKHVRYAASRYKVVEVFAGGGSALVQWRLETGRTHQIRVHAKYIGVPLLGDELYGGTKDMAISLLRPKTPRREHGHISQMISELQRPCLHAQSLGFKHPHTGERMRFSCPPPADFSHILDQLRSISHPSESN